MQIKKFLITLLLVSILCSLAAATAVSADQVYTEGNPEVPVSNVTLPSFSALVSEVGPAVVNISVESDAKDETIEIPGAPFTFKGNTRPITSLGSGFVISDSGFIVTNYHVVEKGGKIIVRLLDDKNEYLAQLAGKDEKTDIALLKIEPPPKLKKVMLGDSNAMEVGDWVLAIGNQFQLGQTVTQGIVSATSRKVPRGGPYDDFIQTDASINPGSSGGPLFNLKGQVVGINTAIFSPNRTVGGGTGFNIGIGFATPINIAKGILNQLRDDGKVTRGWLGVLIQQVNPDVAYALKLPDYHGALVGHVLPDSPAARAGFQHGDVIQDYDGKPVHENDELPLMVANTPIGRTVDVRLLRKGKEMHLPVTIEELKAAPKSNTEEQTKADEVGLELENVTPMIAKFLGLPADSGVHVVGIEPGSKAEAAGLSRGDIILSLATHESGEKAVADIDSFRKMLRASDSKKPVLLYVLRSDRGTPSGSSSLYLALKRE